jgi:hypothetical protein
MCVPPTFDSKGNEDMKPRNTHLIAALAARDESTRLKAALAISSNPEPGLVDTLIARCAIKPNFYVRDMLKWALTRFPFNLRFGDRPGL